MTKQEMFNKVVKHLRQQKGRAVEDNNDRQCLYLAPDGRKCAIGIFLPKGHPAQDYKGAVSGLMARHPDIRKVLWLDDGPAGIESYVEQSRFLGDLQQLHDKERNWTREGDIKEEAIQQLATIWELEYTAP